MKRRRLMQLPKMALVAALITLIAGCTFFDRQRQRIVGREQERTREVTQAALVANEVGRDALTDTNVDKALIAYDLSNDFVRRSQNIMGLPIQDQTRVVMDLLSENNELRKERAKAEVSREKQEEVWRRDRSEREAALIGMGTKYEVERNKKTLRGWLSGLGIGGTILTIILLCVFVPAFIPIFARIVGWIVKMVPQLAGYVGVVSKGVVDRMYVAIEKQKMERPEDPGTKALLNNLSKEMDNQDKELIEARRNKVPVVMEPKKNEASDPVI